MEGLRLMVVWCSLISVHADMYLHNPRGSNNRLDEQGRQRNNANRLFDSQNNKRGGYNVGSVYYYAGSNLQIEWTNQHSCQTENNHCEIIIQYMCGDNVRDGATTTTIPDNLMNCDDYDCNTDKRYGMHEDYHYYMGCKARERNKGLFIADQNLNRRQRAINTRQNPQGTRRGYECPEERDYYPYWHPSPWKDIVVMTNNATRCPYYQTESENVKGRWFCHLPPAVVMQASKDHDFLIPGNQTECLEFTWPKNDPDGVKGEWREVAPHGLDAPDCHEGLFSRDNHLGNGLGGYPNTYNWTLPDLDADHCTLRIRYNISTQDYEAWDDVDASNNEQKNTDYANLDLSEPLGFADRATAEGRGYVFKNNPEVEIFKDLDTKWRLAINTAQFGRTFQDRSHTFAIRRRPESLRDVTIHNVNVRGKRGNIVQVYPAVEYDFVPNTLEAKPEDYVHFQWTGSNTNPHNNDGQGRQGTDRSNVVLQDKQVYDEGSGGPYGDLEKNGHWGRSYPDTVAMADFLGLPVEDLAHLALLTPHQFGGEMSELDDAGTYFDLGPRKVTSAGVFHYMCTRNNNFSNRSQKGRLIVRDVEVTQRSVGWNGGNVTSSSGEARVIVPQGAFAELKHLRVEQWPAEEGQRQLEENSRVSPGQDYASDFLVLQPEEQLSQPGEAFEIVMAYQSSLMEEAIVYHTDSQALTWTRVDSVHEDTSLRVRAEMGGTYVAINHAKGGAIAGVVIGCLVAVALIVLLVVFLKRNPPKVLSRSMASRI